VYRVHQDLFGLRRRLPWLVRGVPVPETVANTALTYRVNGPDGEHILVALNVGDGPLTVSAPGYRLGAGSADLGSDAAIVPAHAFAVLLPATA
jgi:hypothetical protein